MSEESRKTVEKLLKGAGMLQESGEGQVEAFGLSSQDLRLICAALYAAIQSVKKALSVETDQDEKSNIASTGLLLLELFERLDRILSAPQETVQ